MDERFILFPGGRVCQATEQPGRPTLKVGAVKKAVVTVKVRYSAVGVRNLYLKKGSRLIRKY